MNDPSVRKQKSGDQLSVGDWLAPNELLDGAAEVLHVLAYRPEKPYHEDDLKHVHLVVREQGKVEPYADVVSGHNLFSLASEEDLAELREQAERTQKISEIRALATWLEDRPWLPIPDLHSNQHLHGLDGYRHVLELAERPGAQLDTHLDDRTKVDFREGPLHYSVIAWHEDGRPAEPAPEPKRGHVPAEHHHYGGWKGEGPGTCGAKCACGVTFDGFDTLAEAVELVERHVADPLGLDRSRADEEPDDPTPVSPARVPLHTGGMTDGGLVDESDSEDLGCSTCGGNVRVIDGELVHVNHLGGRLLLESHEAWV